MWLAADADEILRRINRTLKEWRPDLDMLGTIDREMDDEIARVMEQLPEDKRAELAALETSLNELDREKATPRRELGEMLVILRKWDRKTARAILTSFRNANKRAFPYLKRISYERQQEVDALLAKLNEPDEEECIQCGKRRSRPTKPRQVG